MRVIEFLLQLLERPLRWQRVLAWVLLVSLILALFYFGSQPTAGGLFPSGWDKMVHILFFGGVASLAFIGTGSRRPIYSIILVGVLGLLDEIGQSFNPARVASVADWLADIAGACLALLLIRVVAGTLRATRAS